jgi:hypothetical protein
MPSLKVVAAVAIGSLALSACVVAPYPQRVYSQPVPVGQAPGPYYGGEDVVVDVARVGICGTDREICGFHYGTPPIGLSRLVLGHEAVGEVVAVGRAVRTLAPGDLVAFTVRRPCEDQACVACRAGRQDFCITGAFRERGIKEADGFMTELVVEDLVACLPLARIAWRTRQASGPVWRNGLSGCLSFHALPLSACNRAPVRPAMSVA